MKVLIDKLNIEVNIKNDNIIHNKVNNILRSIRISLKRNYNKSFESYLKDIGFDLKMCNICKEEYAKYDLDFEIKNNIFTVKNVFYPENKIYCYSKNKKCPGKKMNPNSVEFISKSMNLTEKEALDYIHKNNKSPFYLSNHDSIEEYKKYQTRDLSFFNNENEYNKWKEKLKRGHKIETYIEKYGKVEGTKIWKNIQKKKNSCSLEFYLKKYKTEKEALLEYSKRLEKVIPNSSSKEADSFFKKLTKILYSKFNINKDDITTNYKDNKEFRLVYYFYDYCIHSHKIIIEYNGKLWHPNKEYYTKEEWNKWKHPFNENLNADDVYKKDKQKLAIALSKGYKVITVWSDKEEKYNIDLVIQKLTKYING
jgi:very-short-patch-repair endonuclease